MNIFIPNIDFSTIDKRRIFIATRPFFLGSSWGNDTDQKKSWSNTDHYTDDINSAHVLLVPKPINRYSNKELIELNALCKKHNIKGYGYISGDYGNVYKSFDQLIYFRVGGFIDQLPKNNLGLPVALSDIYASLYKDRTFKAREKQQHPNIGFCGHASPSIKKKFRDKLAFAKKNIVRFFQNPLRIDYEPLFASAYERFKLLKALETSSLVKSNFIFREQYRAGAVTKELRRQTNKEYYDNIMQSDYVLCVRGAGNFSVRLYETLMMGRIPVFVDTKCLLPFTDDIDWKKHMVWVPWEQRNDIDKIIIDFHKSLNQEEFIQLQHANRSLWQNSLSVIGIFNYIRKNAITI